MSDLWSELAGFAPTGRAAWRNEVEKALKGRAYDDALIRHTPEGLILEPLYTDRPAGELHVGHHRAARLQSRQM